MIRKSGNRFSDKIMLHQDDMMRSFSVANRAASVIECAGRAFVG